MEAALTWLMIVCGASANGSYCYNGGVSVARVTEAQCKASVQSAKASGDMVVRCVAPDGRVLTSGAKAGEVQ